MAIVAPTSAAAFPLAEADLCVKCGLCLPHCPTYLDARNEADSPRGRIALMQGLATGVIDQTAKLELHLDGCLSCRACEAVCPAKVPYGALIDAGRALLAERRPARVRALAPLSVLLSHRPLRRALGALLRLYQRSGMQKLLRRSGALGRGRIARLEGLLPQIAAATRVDRPTIADSANDSVQLFVGCVSDLVEAEAVDAAARLFAACGYALRSPAAQTCCGALDQHGGRPATARGLAAHNLTAFAGDAPIVAMASGCGASLLDYATMLGSAEARRFAARVRDPARLLLARAERLQLQPLRARVAIHVPCTQQNVLRDPQATRALLAHIPQIELLELESDQRCCGAAGLNFVTQPQASDRLLEPKLAAARRLQPDFIVSANIGCSLHLSAGLRRDGSTVPVLHPLTLLARQLRA
ncbi:MAG: (Fe-S)-binding protein [Nevskia sp.]|nr:(Fe-S)-binding protein [Nevskia sp.]